jgi:hypothetical protein
MNGKFVISLDFELMWGVLDKHTIDTYGENVIGVHEVLPKILNILNEYKINTTIALVGFLFYKNKKQLISDLPEILPDYKNSNLNPYYHMVSEDLDFKSGKYFFAPHLIDLIKQYPNIEIGSHTYSHYLCLENGLNINQFESDLKKFISISNENSIRLYSIVFPRNQYSEDHLKVCYQNGILSYRGNENKWYYEPKSTSEQNLFVRFFRLIDTYVNISGHNCYDLNNYIEDSRPLNIPSSRFLRPYNSKLKLLEWFRLKRIKNSMTYAAKNGLTYHLWWHPHNFGKDINENLSFLNEILKHFNFLNTKYNFKSYSMFELSKQYSHEK